MMGKLTFISGGVRSGKSAYAEKVLVDSAAKFGGRLVYIASGRAVDEEMRQRIEKHKLDRAKEDWLTIEQPVNLEGVLLFIQRNDLVLWDCLTTWLANELYTEQDGIYCIRTEGCMEQKAARLMQTVAKIREKAAHLIIVSNEVLDEPASTYEETRTYCEWIGKLHQCLVSLSDDAIEMDCGMPMYWKTEGQVIVR
ncbi:bifunctional adenosylcobinamide kinase/adenosylcobinamide-phosphate guanylyltransferase [Sporosarcina sp. ACRSL]|uniref:bifunctional adenosylcobinamide kinase/adenosylcobinamide-phosphate guanylyltransferase n=1 Tax=Sporosarcina sp. ACRSL TaxID=2918215 RepID=UPI001EF512CD|nr:bifunctional adenosylcobinamide kinase/adenosylcobinamide-phosphate guanylyltransferase [Sporosarcina sp. ACRSL]MCG7343866.1 bifunctional adenosylcobinamide kinase/adenosylcobinamide-phosphate guanylyltransferase [Sporosarcina sp. ACRSL]